MAVRRKTYARLQQEIKELEAQLIYRCSSAHEDLQKASTERLTGSGVMLELTFLGGKAVINPVVIRDGLGDDTIEALRRDLCRSYELATMFKPGPGGNND